MKKKTKFKKEMNKPLSDNEEKPVRRKQGNRFLDD